MTVGDFDDLFEEPKKSKYTYVDALRDIRETQDLIKDLRDFYPEIWDKAEDWFRDVGEQQKAVFRTIKLTQRVSHNQQDAISNWGVAVRKWHPDYRD